MLNGRIDEMFYGVEQSTDLRCPRTVVKKFASESALKRWLNGGGGEFTYADPESARNGHHTFRYGYELKGRIDRKHKIFSNVGSRDYPRCAADNLASYIARYGYPVEDRR